METRRHRAKASAIPRVALNERLLSAVERLVVSSVAITAASLAAAPDGLGLSLQQWRVLVILASVDRIRVGEIARDLGTSLPTASRIVHRLARRGLVVIERDETDRRAFDVRSTPAGAGLRDEIVERRRAGLRIALAAVSPHLEGAHGLIDELAAALTISRPHAVAAAGDRRPDPTTSPADPFAIHPDGPGS